jgi:hypothetical protein
MRRTRIGSGRYLSLSSSYEANEWAIVSLGDGGSAYPSTKKIMSMTFARVYLRTVPHR